MNEYTFRESNSILDFAASWEGLFSKRKEFAFLESKFMPFSLDAFEKELDVQESKQQVTEFAWQKIYQKMSLWNWIDILISISNFCYIIA